MARRTVLAIRHVHFEDLGSLVGPLDDAGYDIEYVDVADADLGSLDPLACDIMVVLGGPVAVYDVDAYPFLSNELGLLRTRLAADLPTMGICLGAQLIAAALGARVYPGSVKEIGWSQLELTPMGEAGPLAAVLDTPVLHWHGDTFDLPAGCDLLASTALCRQQAFSRGRDVLAMQFHPEVLSSRFEHWLIGHASELGTNKIDPILLRGVAARHGPQLEAAARSLMATWLAILSERDGQTMRGSTE